MTDIILLPVFLPITNLLKAFIAFLFLKCVCKPKYGVAATLLGFTLMFAALLLSDYLIDDSVIGAAIFFIINFAVIKIFSLSSFKMTAEYSAALTLSLYFSQAFGLFISTCVLDILRNGGYEPNEILSVFAAIPIYLAVSDFAKTIFEKKSERSYYGKKLWLFLLPLASSVIISSFEAMMQNFTLDNTQFIYITALSALLSAENILVYLIFDKSERNAENALELGLTNQRNETDLKYLEILESNNRSMQIAMHDCKNHLLTISGMTDDNEIKKYVNGLVGGEAGYSFSSVARTNNRLLNVILNKYSEICKKKGISLGIDILTDNLRDLDDSDLSALFNNILDNAVEGAEKTQAKKISLQISNVLNAYRKIEVTNSCDKKPISNGDELVSDKPEKERHGFGIKSIQSVSEKYGGEFDWDYDEGKAEFRATVLLPLA